MLKQKLLRSIFVCLLLSEEYFSEGWQSQGKQQEDHQMLAGVYGWFTEGFDTKDLQEAKALLERLRG